MPARKAEAASGDLFVTRRSFAAIVNGRTIIVQPGTIVSKGDALLKGREALFMPFEPTITSTRVEQATAAPGEVRG